MDLLDQEDGDWVLNLPNKESFELYHLVEGVNSLSMKGNSLWSMDRTQADLVVVQSSPYRVMDSLKLTLNEDDMSIYLEADNGEYLISVKSNIRLFTQEKHRGTKIWI